MGRNIDCVVMILADLSRSPFLTGGSVWAFWEEPFAYAAVSLPPANALG
jgi:hypothetical protein